MNSLSTAWGTWFDPGPSEDLRKQNFGKNTDNNNNHNNDKMGQIRSKKKWNEENEATSEGSSIFMGHVVMHKGLKPDPVKVEPCLICPNPKTLKASNISADLSIIWPNSFQSSQS